MRNKPNTDSVAKVLAAGIVPGCKVKSPDGLVFIVPSVEEWKEGIISESVWIHDGGLLFSGMTGDVCATIIEPAPSLPDTFDPFAHGHLITERFPATDEQP
jgi:hypothetical protein